ncbi:MAG: hypothetical protein ACYCW5_05940 [Thermoleophilia bacterium]
MAQCPVCKRYDIFGEQASYLNVISDHYYFDCPECGAFRMNLRTRTLSMNLSEDDAQSLLVWILEQNAGGKVPMVKETLVLKISRGSREQLAARS